MKKETSFLLIGILLFTAALLIPSETEILRLILFLLAFIFSGAKVMYNAAKSIARGNFFNENTLMIIAAVGAFCIKEYPEAVFVVLFYRIGEGFEDRAVERSRRSIAEVINICPEYANLVREDKIEKVDPEEVSVGDIIMVAAGERIPLDGEITEGCSYIDTSALTGESLPRSVIEGDRVLSGCINKNSALKIRVTESFEDSTLTRILELVETASSKKSSSERFITKFAKYYTPIVLISALMLAFLPPLLIKGAELSDFVYRALSFLVVSCPCALVISVPLAFFTGIGGAAKKGILIKGGNYLEALSKAGNVVFDKTGTLTCGSFRVSDVSAVNTTKDILLEYAAYAENISGHPIAKAVRELYGHDIDITRITSCEEIAGKGVKAIVDGKTVYAGNIKLMELVLPKGEELHSHSQGSTVHVATDGVYMGSISVTDEIKGDALGTIASLKRSGAKKTYMLTGDSRKNAEEVSSELGIDEVKSELLPDGKVSALEGIMAGSRGKTVYVGDGINDAPVLARSDVGIAMGALGSDAAIEAADIVIMTDELSKIPTALQISKKTMAIAKQNIVFSLIIKIGILILCSLDIVGMGVAVFGDVGVMMLAVLNSFRALK